MTLRIGLLVNPIAGLGGAAGLKGSDTDWQQALDEGYEPTAVDRARRFVDAADKDAEITWLTAAPPMGLDGLPELEADVPDFGTTTAEDTQRIAQALRDAGVDLIVFAGGDGTATDVAQAVGTTVPCLGVPAGVKITSPVFAHDPEEAAWLVAHLAPGFETVDRDVTDLDEAAYRQGRLDVHLTGSLAVPVSPLVQGGKVPTTGDTPLEPLADMVLRDWDEDALWLVGAGSVCRAVKARFHGQPTLLGVDAIVGDKIVATDLDAHAAERMVADAAAQGRPVRILLSLIGGQGMLIGRGTQVLSPAVLRAVGWDGITVVAPPEKLLGLRAVWVDSGDPAFEEAAPKHIRVISGWNETRLVRCNPKPSS